MQRGLIILYYINQALLCAAMPLSVVLFAKKLSEVLNTPFIPNKGKQKYLKEKPKYLMDTSHYGSEKARTEGSKTLENVKEAMSMQFF